MEQKITINGMKCDGCTKIVKEKFAAIHGVSTVTVDLKEKSAVIVSTRAIPTSELQQALVETKFIVA